MSLRKITTLVEGDLFSVFVFLEGFQIDLNFDGNETYQSTNTVNVDGLLDLTFHAFGVPTAEWKITLSEGGNTLSEDEGAIGKFNQSVLVKAIELPAPPQGAAKAAKKAAKKGGGGDA